MTTRTSANFWLDIASLVVMVGLAATGGLIHFVLPPGTGHSHTILGLGRHDFGQVHFYLAVAVVILLAVHLLLHWSWICSVIAKMAGRAAPSRRSQTAWGLLLLVGVAALLGASLYWAATAVEQTTTPRRGRAHRDSASRPTAPGSARKGGDAAESRTTVVARELIVARSSTAARRGRGGNPEKHLEDCPAGASISGRTSLNEAARICGFDVEQMRQHLALPPGVDHGEQLGRLRRHYGFAIHDVRKLACR